MTSPHLSPSNRRRHHGIGVTLAATLIFVTGAYAQTPLPPPILLTPTTLMWRAPDDADVATAQTASARLYVDAWSPTPLPVEPLTILGCAGALGTVQCWADLPLAVVARLKYPDALHTLELQSTTGDVTQRVPVTVLRTVADCLYAAPGVTATTTRPRGASLQGFNLLAGQAARIGQLRAWGWRVEWQMDGSGTRLLLLAWCEGMTGSAAAFRGDNATQLDWDFTK